jgi:hypothetical protein
MERHGFGREQCCGHAWQRRILRPTD